LARPQNSPFANGTSAGLPAYASWLADGGLTTPAIVDEEGDHGLQNERSWLLCAKGTRVVILEVFKVAARDTIH